MDSNYISIEGVNDQKTNLQHLPTKIYKSTPTPFHLILLIKLSLLNIYLLPLMLFDYDDNSSDKIVNLIDQYPPKPKSKLGPKIFITFDFNETIKEHNVPLYIVSKVNGLHSCSFLVDPTFTMNVIIEEHIFNRKLQCDFYNKVDVLI